MNFKKTLLAAMPKMIGNPLSVATAMVSFALSVVKGQKAKKATKGKKKTTVRKSKILSKKQKQQMEVMERICQSVYGTYIRGATTIAARYIGHPAVAIPASEMVKTMMDEVAPPINKYCVIHTEQKQKIETNDIVQIAQIYKNAIEETKQYLKDKKLYIPTVNDYLLTGYNGTIQSVQYLMDKYCPELGETLDNIKAKKAEMISYFYENNRQIYIKNPEIGTVFDKILFNVPIDETNMNIFEKTEVAIDGVVSGFLKDIASGANAVVDMALSPLDTAEALTSPGALTLGTVWNGLTEDIVNDWQKGTIQGKTEAVGRTISIISPIEILKATGVIGKGAKVAETLGRAADIADTAVDVAKRVTDVADTAVDVTRGIADVADTAVDLTKKMTDVGDTAVDITKGLDETADGLANTGKNFTDDIITVERGNSGANDSGVKISREKPKTDVGEVKTKETGNNKPDEVKTTRAEDNKLGESVTHTSNAITKDGVIETDKISNIHEGSKENLAKKQEKYETVTYRRVQGGDGGDAGYQISRNRIIIDDEGNVFIPNKKSNLNISVDNGEHSQYYARERRPGADIYEFEVPKWLDDMVNEYIIPQSHYRTNLLNQGKTAPKLTDVSTDGISIEFPPPWPEWIEEYATNGRIVKGEP